MKNIIITCGTSIFNEFTITNTEHLKQSQKLDDNIGSYNDIYKSIYDKYLCCENNQLGAEICILLKLQLSKEDNIYFFFSETKGGELVKKIFEETDILKDKIGDYTYNFKTISGFKVDNKDIFKNQAIPDFYKKLEEIKLNGDVTIMCPVGGYKALIPYASLYAMVNGWDIKYIYEDSDELMDLTNGLLGYLNIKSGITDNNFKNVIAELEKGEKSIFSEKIDFDFTNKLIEATNRFIELGDLSGFNKIETDDIKLKKLLNMLGDFDLKIKFGQIRKVDEITKIINEIKNYNNESNIFSPIFNKISQEFSKFEINNNDLNFYFSILNFYKEKNKLLEGFLFMREFFVDCISYLVFGKIYLGDEEDKISSKELNISNSSYKSAIKKLKEGCTEVKLTNSCIKLTKLDIRYYIDFKIISDINYLKNDFEREINLNSVSKTYKHNKIDNGEELADILKHLKDIRNYFAHYGTGNNREGNTIKIDKEIFNKYVEILKDFKNSILKLN